MLEHITIEPKGDAQAAIIWLHGLGADGHDFEPIVPELDVEDLNIRYIFPHAPERPVTINNGEQMRAWFDFQPHTETAGNEDIDTSAAQLMEFIEAQMSAGIPSHRILLAGFSQGGVIALHTACLLYTSPSPRDRTRSRMPSSA